MPEKGVFKKNDLTIHKIIIVWTVASFISVFEVLIDHRINIDPWSFPMIMSPA